jgi:hypothetical protein
MITSIKTKLVRLIKSLLKEGMSLEKISLCIALGVALGIFPVLGTVYSTGEGTSKHLGKLTTSGQVTLTWTPVGISIQGSAT